MNFKELQLHPLLLRAIEDKGYTQPSPIQEKAIPPAMKGVDVLGCAQTGTGKTAAFSLPILHHLLSVGTQGGNRKIKALILTPTRELALQIAESFTEYGKYTKLRCVAIFGGVGIKPQIKALNNGIDVLVATPGRLNDLINQGFVDLRALDTFVLDEADRMLDMGFIHDVKRVIKCLPTKRQTLFFSATMPKEVEKLVNELLVKHVKVQVTPASSTVEIIEQYIYFVDRANKKKLLIDILNQEKFASVLIFTRTKHGADHVVKDLARVNIKAAAIHGNKSQNARQAALQDFKSGKLTVLIATDIAARGIDIDQLSCVMNFDLPNIPETYVHRIGRTGRAGLEGIALSFCDFEEKAYLKTIEKLIDQKIPVRENENYPLSVFEIPPKNTQQRPPRRPAGDNASSPFPPRKPGAGRGKNPRFQRSNKK